MVFGLETAAVMWFYYFTWPKIPVHVNLTNPHPGSKQRNTSSKVVHFCGDGLELLAKRIKAIGPSW
jgi:hypothetical protein